ncbi:hypothetical protein BOX15_Mlig026957g1, partial [Macrostomum lignano]
ESAQPSKRTRATAMSVFMREYRNSNPALRSLPHSSSQLIAEANSAFKSLSLEQRQVYERKAKAENKKFDQKFGDKFRRDCEGFTLESRAKASQEAEAFRRWSEDLLRQMLSDAELQWLLDRPFVVGELFDFAPADPHESRQNLPAELGFVRFSLRSGVTDRLHHIVSLTSQQLPMHLRFQCKDLAEETHGIHIDHQLGGSVAAFDRELRRLCQDDSGRPLPLFVPADSLQRMQHGLMYIYGSSADLGTCPLVIEPSKLSKSRVLSLEPLMRHLMACPAMPEDKRASVLDLQMTALLQKVRFTGYSECCQFHTGQDNTEFCALTRAHRYAWAIFELLYDRLGFELTTAHRPLDEQLVTPPAPIRREDQPRWLENSRWQKRANPSPPRSVAMATQPTTSAAPANASANGAAAENFQAFGRGRGRGVRLTEQPPMPMPPPAASEDAAIESDGRPAGRPAVLGRGRGIRSSEPPFDNASRGVAVPARFEDAAGGVAVPARFEDAARGVAAPARFEDAAIDAGSSFRSSEQAAFEDAAPMTRASPGPPPGLSSPVGGAGRGGGAAGAGIAQTARPQLL